MAHLDKEFDWYIAHHNEMVEKYDGKFVVIRGHEVLGAFDTYDEAYTVADRLGILDEVLLHEVGPGEENYMVRSHSAWYRLG